MTPKVEIPEFMLGALAEAHGIVLKENDILRQQLAEAQALIEASRKQEPAGVLRSDEFDGHVFEPKSGWPFGKLYAAPVIADDVLKDAQLYQVALSNCIDAIENCQALFNHKPLEGFAKTCAGANDIALELARAAMGSAA